MGERRGARDRSRDRLPTDGGSVVPGTVWAEDGPVFLQRAYVSNIVTGPFEPYNGYASAVSQAEAELVSWAPLPWQGVLICLAAALTQALVALLAYHVVRAHAPRRIAATLAVVAVCAVPVGPETMDNVANSQWFLLAAGVLAPLWAPRRPWGQAASIIALVAICLTGPFGVLCVGLAVVVVLLTRSRRALLLAGSGFVALAVQGAVIVSAPPRPPGLRGTTGLNELAPGYLRRVLGDGVLGIWRHGTAEAPGWTTGLLVLAAVALLAALVGATGQGRALVVPGVLVALSVATFVAPVALSRLPTTSPLVQGRYFVAPAILVLVALGLVAEAALTGVRRSPVPRSRATSAAARVVTAGLLVAVAFGSVTSWSLPDSDPRNTARSWHDEVDRAARQCASSRPSATRMIRISPPGFAVVVTCAQTRK